MPGGGMLSGFTHVNGVAISQENASKPAMQRVLKQLESSFGSHGFASHLRETKPSSHSVRPSVIKEPSVIAALEKSRSRAQLWKASTKNRWADLYFIARKKNNKLTMAAWLRAQTNPPKINTFAGWVAASARGGVGAIGRLAAVNKKELFQLVAEDAAVAVELKQALRRKELKELAVQHFRDLTHNDDATLPTSTLNGYLREMVGAKMISFGHQGRKGTQHHFEMWMDWRNWFLHIVSIIVSIHFLQSAGAAGYEYRMFNMDASSIGFWYDNRERLQYVVPMNTKHVQDWRGYGSNRMWGSVNLIASMGGLVHLSLTLRGEGERPHGVTSPAHFKFPGTNFHLFIVWDKSRASQYRAQVSQCHYVCCIDYWLDCHAVLCVCSLQIDIVATEAIKEGVAVMASVQGNQSPSANASATTTPPRTKAVMYMDGESTQNAFMRDNSDWYVSPYELIENKTKQPSLQLAVTSVQNLTNSRRVSTGGQSAFHALGGDGVATLLFKGNSGRTPHEQPVDAMGVFMAIHRDSEADFKDEIDFDQTPAYDLCKDFLKTSCQMTPKATRERAKAAIFTLIRFQNWNTQAKITKGFTATGFRDVSKGDYHEALVRVSKGRWLTALNEKERKNMLEQIHPAAQVMVQRGIVKEKWME
jgi:hypothetical protein